MTVSEGKKKKQNYLDHRKESQDASETFFSLAPSAAFFGPLGIPGTIQLLMLVESGHVVTVPCLAIPP